MFLQASKEIKHQLATFTVYIHKMLNVITD